MSKIYKQDHVMIVKLDSQTYIAYILNDDKTIAKFLDSDIEYPAYAIKGYIYQRYHTVPIWIETASSLIYSMQQTIQKYEPPVEDFMYEDSVIEDSWSQKKLKRVIAERRAAAEEKYERVKNSYPSFSSNYTITDYEIFRLMDFCQDRSYTPNYLSY